MAYYVKSQYVVQEVMCGSSWKQVFFYPETENRKCWTFDFDQSVELVDVDMLDMTSLQAHAANIHVQGVGTWYI